LDRPTPDFSYLNSACIARVLVYPSSITEIYDSVTPSNHWSNDVINYDSVFITEIGLYNPFGELVAVAKLSEPVEKTYVNALTFEINLEM
jgi:hypothetical protein